MRQAFRPEGPTLAGSRENRGSILPLATPGGLRHHRCSPEPRSSGQLWGPDWKPQPCFSCLLFFSLLLVIRLTDSRGGRLLGRRSHGTTSSRVLTSMLLITPQPGLLSIIARRNPPKQAWLVYFAAWMQGTDRAAKMGPGLGIFGFWVWIFLGVGKFHAFR